MLLICDSLGTRIQETDHIKIAAFPGATTDKVKRKIFEGELDSFYSDTWCICVAVGTNNIETETPQKIVQELIKIIQILKCHQRNKVFAITSIIPRRDDIPRQAKVPIVNEILKKKCKILGFDFVNTYKTLAKSKFKLKDPDHWYRDNLHLSAKGKKNYNKR